MLFLFLFPNTLCNYFIRTVVLFTVLASVAVNSDTVFSDFEFPSNNYASTITGYSAFGRDFKIFHIFCIFIKYSISKP